MTDFSVQRGYQDREATAIILTAQDLGLTYKTVPEPIPGTIPVGSVEFCAPVADFPVNFFPMSLVDYIGREYVFVGEGHKIAFDWFVKDLGYWKTDFETKRYPKGYELPAGRFFVSEPVHMKNEWRYYVVEGDIIDVAWYRGEDEDKLPPFEIEFPKDITGAIDFAEVDGKPELIEAHAPFACGWYGEGFLNYTYWQYFAWKALI